MQYFNNLTALHRFNGFPAPENPLISVYRSARTCELGDREFTSDFYMIGFKKVRSGVIRYGRTRYDSDAGSMLFFKPRQIIEFTGLEYDEDAFIIFIHEDFLNGSPLHEEIQRYGFFDYEANEALHLTPREEQVMWDLFFKIEAEYQNNTDEYSRAIMLTHIDSMLKYSQRFYKRQFINRTVLSGKTVSRFNNALSLYFDNGMLQTKGLPTVNAIAADLNISPSYLSDLLKQETGKTAMELIHIFLINKAKNLLRTEKQNISEIAFALGFENLPYFSRLFKRETGLSPNQFKKQLIN